MNHKRREQEKGRKKSNKNKFKTINKVAIRTYISIIILNVNGLNAPTKRHRLDEWIQKQDPYIYIYIYAVFKGPTSLLRTHTN